MTIKSLTYIFLLLCFCLIIFSLIGGCITSKYDRCPKCGGYHVLREYNSKFFYIGCYIILAMSITYFIIICLYFLFIKEKEKNKYKQIEKNKYKQIDFYKL